MQEEICSSENILQSSEDEMQRPSNEKAMFQTIKALLECKQSTVQGKAIDTSPTNGDMNSFRPHSLDFNRKRKFRRTQFRIPEEQDESKEDSSDFIYRKDASPSYRCTYALIDSNKLPSDDFNSNESEFVMKKSEKQKINSFEKERAVFIDKESAKSAPNESELLSKILLSIFVVSFVTLIIFPLPNWESMIFCNLMQIVRTSTD